MDKVSAGRNNDNGLVGLVKLQLCQFNILPEPAVYNKAAASPKPRPAARMTPVMIRGRQAGNNT